MKNDYRNKIVELYISNKSLEEILRNLGWKRKGLSKLTRILREEKFKIPYSTFVDFWECGIKMSREELEIAYKQQKNER